MFYRAEVMRVKVDIKVLREALFLVLALLILAPHEHTLGNNLLNEVEQLKDRIAAIAFLSR
jgi:hypothetical protein